MVYFHMQQRMQDVIKAVDFLIRYIHNNYYTSDYFYRNITIVKL